MDQNGCFSKVRLIFGKDILSIFTEPFLLVFKSNGIFLFVMVQK